MIPATCHNCSNGAGDRHTKGSRPANLGVILGVVGGLALTAIVVFLCVPWVRRRSRYRPGTRDVESSAGGGSQRSRWRFASRRCRQSSGSARMGESAMRAGGRHHLEKEREVLPLLPELEVSTFTWSDLHRSNEGSAAHAKSVREGHAEGSGGSGDSDSQDSATDEDDGLTDVSSPPTANATLSHRSTPREQPSPTGPGRSPAAWPAALGVDSDSARPSEHPLSVLGGPSNRQFKHTAIPARHRGSQVPPSATGSGLSPPGLVGGYNLHLRDVPTDPTPTVPLPPSDAFPRFDSYFAHHPRPALDVAGGQMDVPVQQHPVSERASTKSRSSGSRSSRQDSLQLPSPPASPPPPHPHHAAQPSSKLSRSNSHSSHAHARNQSQSHPINPADWRFNGSRGSLARPPLTSTVSAPTALPFRPHASASSRPGSSSSHPVLTSAFRSPLHRSNTSSSSSEYTRNPSLLSKSPSPIPETDVVAAAYHAPSAGLGRLRSPSVMSERPARTPQGARPRPVDVLREEEAARSSSRASRRASMSAAPSSAASSPYIEPGHRDRAYLRQSTASLQTPRIEEPYQPAAQATVPTYVPVERSPRSPPVSMPPGIEEERVPPSRRHSVASANHYLQPAASSSRTKLAQQPALVRRQDSSALRPLPLSASTFMHSPPSSPPRGTSHSRQGSVSHSRQGSISSGTSGFYARSRAGSVVSLADDRLGRNPSIRAVLPPMERLSPMDLNDYAYRSQPPPADDRR